jgi:hypothetical protein
MTLVTRVMVEGEWGVGCRKTRKGTEDSNSACCEMATRDTIGPGGA